MVNRDLGNQIGVQGLLTWPAHDICLHIQGGGWQDRLRSIETFVSETAIAVLSHEWKLDRPTELSVVLADDAFVKGLNISYRDHSGSTNVLSFPAFAGDSVQVSQEDANEPILLGDVVLAFETCVAEARRVNSASPFADHARHLLVHGILHLLGYDHEEEADAIRMEALETRMLSVFSVANPYG